MRLIDAVRRIGCCAIVVLAAAFGVRAVAAGPAPVPTALVSPGADILFDSVGNNESIPDGVISALAEDGAGFLWIGTPEALVRYDGQRFRRYIHEPGDDASLPGSRITALLTASDGRLWIGTQGQGVVVHDPASDRMRRFAGSASGADRVPLGPIRAIAETRDGAIWVGSTGQGLARIARDGSIRRFVDGDDGLDDSRIAALAVDRHGTMWVGTWRGLLRRVADAVAFEPVLSERGDRDGFAGTSVRGLYVALDGALWVGSQQGQMARIANDVLAERTLPRADRVSRWRGVGMNTAAEPVAGQIWIGHTGGIDVYAADGTAPIRRLRHAGADPLGIANADVRALLVDRSGMIWVGSFGGGLKRANPRNEALISRRFRSAHDAPLTQLNVLTLNAANGGGIWAGVLQDGLVEMDSALNVVSVTPPSARADVPNGGGFAGSQPSGIVQTEDGTVWLATEAGLYARRAGQLRFAEFGPDGFPEAASVRRMWPRPRGGIYIATGDGMFRIDADGELRRLGARDGSEVSGTFDALVLLDGGGGWAGGTAGLFRLGVDETLEPIVFVADDGSERPVLQGLLIDRKGTLWVDAEGLYRLDSIDGDRATLTAISHRHGLRDVAFGANLLDDAEGRIWSHRFVYDPEKDQLLRLTRADGAQVGTGWFRAYARLGDGRFVFGATEGLLLVDPAKFAPETVDLPLVVTELRIDGKPRPVGAKPGEIRLTPDERNFALEFAALDFSGAGSLRYRYRLTGVDREWIDTDPGARSASYGGLWPGTYRLEIESSRRTGGWSKGPLAVDIVVEPKWWQTLWGAGAVFAAVMASIALLVRLRSRHLRLETERLEREVGARTQELSAVAAELERKNAELSRASLSDPLTGLKNRRFLMHEMAKETALLERRLERDPTRIDPLMLFLVDIDGFKSINDRYGHAAGDSVLVQFAARLTQVFRASDHLIRWGGEEFLIVARDTGVNAASELAERLRRGIGKTPFVLDDGTGITRSCCVGFAPFPLEPPRPRAHGWETVAELADRALLAAKRSGRDAWIGLYPRASLPDAATPGDWFADEALAFERFVVVSSLAPEAAKAALAAHRLD